MAKAINRQEIYSLLCEIPEGRVTTYKKLAQKIGSKGYRAIGQIVGSNSQAPKIPCHRVVKSDGSVSGYAFGIENKIKILTSEGVKIIDGKIVNFEQKLYKF